MDKETLRHRKVGMSISPEVDNYLNEIKNKTGIKKSNIIALLVSRYGDELKSDVCKYQRKEQSIG